MSTMAAAAAVPQLQPPPPAPTSATPSKRPRLSLQINSKVPNTQNTPSTRQNARGYTLNPSDPTAFNTLSNAYVTAIERSSTPVTEAPGGELEPMTAINTLQSFTLSTPTRQRPRVVTPFVATCPETSISARLDSPNSEAPTPPPPPPAAADSTFAPAEMSYPSVMMNTPQLLSPGYGPPTDISNNTDGSKVFVFSARDTGKVPTSSSSPCRPRDSSSSYTMKRLSAPYTHPSSLHSILRNSPLSTTRRQAKRVHDNSSSSSSSTNAANKSKRVGYNSPLEREIVTNKYTKSHIDLLIEEASPCTPNGDGAALNTEMVDIARAFTQSEIEDGGQTPGPLEDPRRGEGEFEVCKRRRGGGEKKRHWVWTIGRRDEDEDEAGDEYIGGAVSALQAAQARKDAASSPPSSSSSSTVAAGRRHERTPSVDSTSSTISAAADDDVDMSDADSVETADTAVSVGEEKEEPKH